MGNKYIVIIWFPVYDVISFEININSLIKSFFYMTRSSRPDVFCEKVFLEISQNSQENTCARVSFLIKLQAPPAALSKKRPWHRRFPVKFSKFLKTPFFTEHLWWLLFIWPKAQDKNFNILTILTWKNLCFTEFSTKIHWNARLAASDVFRLNNQLSSFNSIIL